MLNRDGEDHRRLRRLVTKAFTPRMVEQLRPRIQEIADELLDAVEARGEMDLSAEYAFPLPITVIAELLGVPPRIATASGLDGRDRLARPRRGGDGAVLRADGRVRRLLERVLRRAPRRRRSDDLVSALLAARDEDDALSEEEMFGTVVLLIVAGHETTVGLIGNAVVNLLAHPEQLGSCRADPSLIPGAVEEVLRYEGPVERALNRWAATDVELGGQTIRRGELVIVILNAADRDPERFADADRLDVHARGHAAPRVRARQPLLPRCAAGAAGGRDRAGDAVPAAARAAAGRRAGTSSNGAPTPGFRRLVTLPVAW